MAKSKSAEIFDTAQVNGPQGLADPLKMMEDARRELFGRYSKASSGFAHRDVVYAAANLILNAIRQDCRTAREAELALEEVLAHGKRSLLDLHYFPGGLRRSVFPHHQTIEMPFHQEKNKIRGS